MLPLRLEDIVAWRQTMVRCQGGVRPIDRKATSTAQVALQ